MGGGADLTEFAPRPRLADSSATLEPQRTSTIPTLCFGALLGVELARHARMSISLLANVPLLSMYYSVELSGARERIVEPYLVRPGLSIALEVH